MFYFILVKMYSNSTKYNMNPENVFSLLVNTAFLVINIYLRGEEFNANNLKDTEILIKRIYESFRKLNLDI